MWFTGSLNNANNDNNQTIYNVDSGINRWTPEALQKWSTIQSSFHSNIPHDQVDWALLAKQWIAMQQSQKQSAPNEPLSGSLRREEIRQESNPFFSNHTLDSSWRKPHMLSASPILPLVNPQLPQVSIPLPAPLPPLPPPPSLPTPSSSTSLPYHLSSSVPTLHLQPSLQTHSFIENPSIGPRLQPLHSSSSFYSPNTLPQASPLPTTIPTTPSSLPSLQNSTSINTNLPPQPFWAQSPLSQNNHYQHHQHQQHHHHHHHHLHHNRNPLYYTAFKDSSTNFQNKTSGHSSKLPISEVNSGVDSNKRKQLPAWIREGLERMEKEKMKKMEKEKEDEERLELLRIQKDQEDKLRKEIEMENEKRKFTKNKEESEKDESNISYYHQHNPYQLGREVNIYKSDQSNEIYENEEEREKELMLRVKKAMTEILLEVTEELIKNVVKDFVFKLKSSRANKQLATATPILKSSGLGGIVTGYESDSQSSTEKSFQQDTKLNEPKHESNFQDLKQEHALQSKQGDNAEESKSNKFSTKYKSSSKSDSKSKEKHGKRKSLSRSRSKSRSPYKDSKHSNKKIKSKSRSRSRDRRYKSSRRSRSRSLFRKRSSNHRPNDRRKQ